MFVRLLLEKVLCFRFGGLVIAIPVVMYFFDTFVFVSGGHGSSKLYVFGLVFLFASLYGALLPYMGYEGASNRAIAERLMAREGSGEFIASLFVSGFVMSFAAGAIAVLNGISFFSLQLDLLRVCISCIACAFGAAGAAAIVHVISWSAGLRTRFVPATVLFVLAGLAGWYFDIRVWNGEGLTFGSLLGTIRVLSFPHWIRVMLTGSLEGVSPQSCAYYGAALGGLGLVGFSLLRAQHFIRGTKSATERHKSNQ